MLNCEYVHNIIIMKMVIMYEAWWEELKEFQNMQLSVFLHKMFSMTFRILATLP